jgi:hypothetical protein
MGCWSSAFVLPQPCKIGFDVGTVSIGASVEDLSVVVVVEVGAGVGKVILPLKWNRFTNLDLLSYAVKAYEGFGVVVSDEGSSPPLMGCWSSVLSSWDNEDVS